MMMLQAADENRKLESVERAYTMTVSVLHALDVAFNKGKGDVLGSWVKSVAGDLIEKLTPKGQKELKKKQIDSEEVMAMFGNMPKFYKEK